MGVLPKYSTPGLMWVFGLLFCALLLQTNTQVSADSQEDSDLVFDSLDATNLRNHRIPRGSSSYSHSESSQPVEAHWLSRTVNRIKRSLGLFSKDEEQPDSYHKSHKDHNGKTLPHPQDHNTNDHHHVKLNRKHRQSDFDVAEEEDEYDGQGQIEDNYDEDDDFDISENNNSNGYGQVEIGEDDLTGQLPNETDDEDIAGLGSGKDGSGEVDTEIIPTTSTAKPVSYPKYYRFTFTAEEYYDINFLDHNSLTFQELAERVRRSVEELFSAQPGNQTATVISITKESSDVFKVRITVDLKSDDWYDEEAIRRVIYEELQNTHRLGELTAVPENFVFRAFEDNRPPCTVNEMVCNNNQCVDRSARCDGIRDCSDNSDEEGCPPPPTVLPEPIPTKRVEPDEQTIPPTVVTTTTPTTTTTSTTTPEPDIGSGDERSDDVFKCADGGGTYYGDQHCDGIRDCEDGTDESDCLDQSKCAQGEYSCDLTRCIPESSRCDGLRDCSDDTDEQECTSCSANAFHCDENRCIQRDRVCDRNPDCRDGADERDCQEPQCLPSEFNCGDGQCIPNYLRCSGTPECSNRADEQNCPTDNEVTPYTVPYPQPTLNPYECRPDQIRCRDGSCVSGQRCDRVYDCLDGTDEEACEYCRSDQFLCRNGQCIDIRLKCDRYQDCSDGSDEENCDIETTPYPTPYPQPTPAPYECSPDQIRCQDGLCVSGKRCDRSYDCPDGSDEENCEYCRSDQFTCRNGLCIDIRLKCDRLRDCSDGSDEEDCGCPTNEIDCEDGTCVEFSRRCDGIADCRNARDEEGCPTGNRTQPTACRADEFDCGDGQCVQTNYRCDGYEDCSNRADEQHCECQPSQFRCHDGTCISSDAECNGNYDCPDGSDETNCTRMACLSNEFRCERENKCIPNWQKCDRQRQCADGSDEVGCDCYANEFRCSSGQCVDLRFRCDGRPDCSDYSDEQNCPITTTPEPVTLPPVTVTPRSCPFGYVSCNSGDQCILRTQLCDGRVDCRDASDEICGTSGEGLQLRTYPNQQEIKENQEVVFQCRDEGPIRARVEWKRANGLPLPPASTDINGRLEMPNIKVEHGGTYVCVAKDYPLGTPGAEISVQLHVEKVQPIYIPPPVKCYLNESTCANGDCIARNKVCDGTYDCSDGSDEIRCRQCEPNEFKCDNKKCVHRSWVCDGQDDCGDGSDERVCAPARPGEGCGAQQFTCRSGQCVPRSFHCDGQPDCIDRSDEIGCTAPVIAEPPPSMISLKVGQTFTITCRAVGVPTPEIIWRLNWHHVPPKCRMTSENGLGTLVCEDIQIEDQGAYSCEAMSSLKTVFATPDTILTVTQESVCRPGFFNVEARTETECIKCFCFGHTSNCRSANLFVFQFQPPFDSVKMLGARIDPYTGVVDIRDEPIYKGVEPNLQQIGRNGVRASLPYYAELNQPDVVPYFTLPENFHGNQLKTYGGYLRYEIYHSNTGRPIAGPEVILAGNNYILLHQSRTPPPAFRTTQQRVRLFDGDWVIKSANQPERLATREEIMMALEDISHILIKLEHNEGILNTTLTNIEMDTAAITDSGLGIANYVEECSCPVGYTGTSCENCAEGYVRHQEGQWLGQCYKEPISCPQGSYFDGRECQICPCPYTNPSSQFARTCNLNTDGNVVCDCQPGYVGLRCELCAPGYAGNPLQPGDICRPVQYCDPQGSLGTDADGRCLCKEYTTGPTCNQCKANTFYLSSNNQFGCISCFCMGVTQQCSSSSWYRDTINSRFTSSTSDFKLVDIYKEDAFTEGIRLNQDSREIAYSSFAQPEVYYWSLPNKYLGDKVTSYGGYLTYTIRNTPVPGGASSRNNAADVELVSENHINLQHFSVNKTQSTNGPQTFVVPLLEQYWQRSDGVKTDREHLLMALADVKNIYIKATYFTNTQEAALISVSLDTATDSNTGRERAYEVEQCHCPPGYSGLSCEDCAFGYTRSDDGIYLELCQPCECNGFSNECHPETGVCINCRDNTAGEQCEQCLPTYVGDPTRGQPCRPSGAPQPCNCDPRGSTYNGCVNGVCQCKANVEGPNCDRCRNGTYGLSADNIDGCEICFCSGVSTECSESQLYTEQIPVQIMDDHGFILTDQYFRQRITSDFRTNLALNEIGFNFPPSQRERMYWSLPNIFTGNQIKSYGGRLEFMQRYIDFPYAQYIMDKDIIITGNGVVIYWTNPIELKPEIVNSVTARLHPSANWYRLDQNKAPRSASREDILTVLANIDSILIRATPSTDTSSTFLSDITLDTAVDVYTAKPRATSVENCRCPVGYRGSSCESCASGYYKDTSYSDTNPLGTCRKCPCYNREESCHFDYNQGVICNCLPGYTGRNCETTDIVIPTSRPNTTTSTVSPPTIEVTISGHTLQIYEIGSSVRLNCSAISRIAPRTVRVHWTKDSGDLPYHAIDDGRGILYIRNLTVSDSGRYTCEAEDGYSIVTESINIAVGSNPRDRPPSIALSVPFLQVSEGQLIEVRCAADGNPLPEYYLSRVDRQPINPTHTFESGLFRILQARVTDAGVYQCTAINRVGQDSRSFEVQVTAGSVLRVEIQPEEYQGSEGDQIVLRCIADRAQSIRWSKENGNLPYQYREENGLLMIPNAQPDDSGIYICTATSYDGTRGTQRATVVIRGSTGVYPSARVSRDRVTLRQGDSIEVNCEATGSPMPSVKWSKINGALGVNSEQIGNTLHVRNARIEDRGVYVCVVTNELGLDQAVTTIEVTRFEPPLLQIYPEGTITVSSGNSAQLQCRAVQGYPSPTITWSRANDRPMSPNVEIMAAGNLRIIGVTPSEAGEYVCAATNEAGTAKATATIIVVSAPELYVTPDQEIITRAVNDYLRLECRGVGEPLPSVSWSRGGIDAYYESQVRTPARSTGVLEFTRLRPEDAGIYICIGQNSAGTTERRVQVDILPERGDNPGGDQGSTPNVEEFNAIVGARAELRCRITSSEGIPHYVDWVRPGNLSLPEGAYIREGTLYIDQVQASAAGDYDCVSYSLPDRTLLFTIKSRLRVVTPPHITLNPSRQVVEPGQNAYIQCSATGDQPIDIQWVPVNRTMPASVYTHDGYIRFSNIHHSDAGMYRCIAKNAAGEADSVSEVVVSYQNPDNQQPSITAEDHLVQSSPGTTVSLRCRPGTGSEQYGVRWLRENDPLPDNTRLSGPILQFYDLRSDNEGRYYCEIVTPTGTVSDYVDLRVVVPRKECPDGWWRCDNGNCITQQLICNGNDDCQDNSDELNCEVTRNPRGPSVKSLPSPMPALHITPQENEYQAGATVDLNCQSNEPGVIPTWSKLSGGLADNVQNRAGRLRIYNVRQDNAGAYRCEATGQRGNYYKDFNLYVKENEFRDEIPLQVQRAKRKASVILECNTELEEPVTYFWSKQAGSLPFYVDEYSKTVQLNSVGAIDAGTYICSATSGKRTLDIPIILVVTGIIPYFTQAPNSYITLPTLPDAYLQFSFEISFKPENDYGLILYNGNREKEKDADFISLALDNGIPEFKFNLGPGTPTTTVRSNASVTEGEWHTIKIVRNKKRVIMFVDGKGPFIGENEGKYFGLDLSEPLFLGGVPDYNNISPEVMMDSGFVGCISKFKIAYTYQDILQESLNTTGITNCETCTENKCQNQGACQEALTTEGYTCICPAGFSGPTCNKRKGQACSPYSCGIGKCIDTENGFTCQCPLGRSGKQCEKAIQVYEPAFRDNAYIAYPAPRPLKRTRIEMRIKPRDTENGLLLYAAETNEGHGDFISLAIKDRHLEFRFDNGRGPFVIRSDQEIVPNEWSAILAIRSSQDGRIVINGHPSTPTRFTANFKTLTLLTHLYVGGYDEHNVKLNQGVKVDKGFNGCIMDINISGLDDAMMKNITDSSNVEDCGADEDDIDNNIFSPEYAHENQYKPIPYDSKKTGCSDTPCKNNAPCIPLSPVEYKCACSAGFTGKNCETTVDLCRNQPCQNGGICKSNTTAFTCDCPLGFSGNTCDQRVELRNDAHFEGNGWLEFSRNLLPHRQDHEAEIVALEFSTNKSDGLIFWHGQSPEEDGQGQDYISLALSNGYLEFSYDLGSGPAIIRNTQTRVDDGERHSVILKREGRSGSIDIDHTYVEAGESEGRMTSMNCNGNIFLGGTPNISKMTGNRFTSGFDGCIHGFELQQSKTLDLGIKAINGLNIKPCSSFNDIDNNIWNEELIN